MWIITILLALSISHASALSFFPPINTKDCGFTREDAVKCLKLNVDINGDSVVESSELRQRIKENFSWPIRMLMYWINIDAALRDCDYDQDGKISIDDFRKSADTCIARPEDLCCLEWF